MPKKPRETLLAPSSLCIYKESTREETFNFFNEILDHSVRRKSWITLDLRNVTDMTAGAALLLFAEVSSAQIARNTPNVFNILPPKNQDLKEKFTDTGLIDALKPGTTGKLEQLWHTGSLFQSGIDPPTCIASTFAILNRKLTDFPGHLITAVSEATLNANQHAYREFQSVQPEMAGRWWQYCYIKDDRLHFLVFDFGVGIPTSLKQNKIMPGDALLLKSPQIEDKDMIAYAMRKGVSRLGKQGRGQGSEDMKKPALEHGNNLLIISGDGRYQLSAGNDKPLLETLPFPIRGTFIEWDLEITK